MGMEVGEGGKGDQLVRKWIHGSKLYNNYVRKGSQLTNFPGSLDIF